MDFIENEYLPLLLKAAKPAGNDYSDNDESEGEGEPDGEIEADGCLDNATESGGNRNGKDFFESSYLASVLKPVNSLWTSLISRISVPVNIKEGSPVSGPTNCLNSLLLELGEEAGNNGAEYQTADGISVAMPLLAQRADLPLCEEASIECLMSQEPLSMSLERNVSAPGKSESVEPTKSPIEFKVPLLPASQLTIEPSLEADPRDDEIQTLKSRLYSMEHRFNHLESMLQHIGTPSSTQTSTSSINSSVTSTPTVLRKFSSPALTPRRLPSGTTAPPPAPPPPPPCTPFLMDSTPRKALHPAKPQQSGMDQVLQELKVAKLRKTNVERSPNGTIKTPKHRSIPSSSQDLAFEAIKRKFKNVEVTSEEEDLDIDGGAENGRGLKRRRSKSCSGLGSN